MSKYTLVLFDLDETLLCSDWYQEGLIKTLGMHSVTKAIDPVAFTNIKLNVPKPIIEQFKKREVTPIEFKRNRWRHDVVVSCGFYIFFT
ncbi:hypothetical protein [Pseudalkalibacillus berkeleyi]|uniref:Uncharacterized protein n=1 Tax=Pseudalkalibacillus berkeleyi TaxID=1069813 RepID=A0ABS9GYD4_9BACL|nr:hypothetical protein [Pseudalkalibacillus berkeleyi]MCF6137694.1 hypothetical protein [Pseudalkalibacillus berkeleyi]